MSRLGVLLVHGMGNSPYSYAEDTIHHLREYLRASGHEPAGVVWKAAHWGSVLENREVELYRRLSQDNDLDWVKIRRDIVISGFGDALAYQGPSTGPSSIAGEVHATFALALRELRDELAAGDHAPLLVMAHSLGCAMISNYIYDCQQAESNPGASGQRYRDRIPASADSPFPRCSTLAGLITFGCNMPLFTLAYRPVDITPIAFPGPEVAAAFPGVSQTQRKRALQWNNYFDPDDILGWPLRPINAAYRKAVTGDHEIQTGTILGAHTDYWHDKDFLRPAAAQIAKLLDLLGS